MLVIDRVEKTYPNGTQALGGVSLEMAAGESVAIIGGSGCGKSTLLRLVAGLDRPTSGTVRLDGAPIDSPHPAVGMVFQEPRLLPWLSIEKNIGFGLDGVPADERKTRIERVLARIGLAGYENAWPRELSGGQAQRVAIARSLITQPKVLLLDEPFAALDAFTRASLQDALLALWRAQKPTLAIVTHDVEEAIILADRVIVMQPRPGRIYAEIRIDIARPRDRLTDEFIAVERRLLSALDGSLGRESQLARRASAEDVSSSARWW